MIRTLCIVCFFLNGTSQILLAQTINWYPFIDTISLNTIDRSQNDYFGTSMAANDQWLIAGVPKATISNAFVYCYRINDQIPDKLELKQIIQSDTLSFNSMFGYSLALGNGTLAIGASVKAGDPSKSIGKVLCYELNDNDEWVLHQTILFPGLDRDKEIFGSKIGIHGNYMVIGVPDADFNSTGSDSTTNGGAVLVYEKDGNGMWILQDYIVAPQRFAGDQFGFRVDVHGDLMAVCAKNHSYDRTYDPGSFINSAGKIYIYRRLENGKWILRNEIVDSERQAYLNFGKMLSLGEGGLATHGYGGPVPFMKLYRNFEQSHSWVFVYNPTTDATLTNFNPTNTYQSGNKLFVAHAGSNIFDQTFGTHFGLISCFEIVGSKIYSEGIIHAGTSTNTQATFGDQMALTDEFFFVSSYKAYLQKGPDIFNSGYITLFAKEECTLMEEHMDMLGCEFAISPNGLKVWYVGGNYKDTLFTVGSCTRFIDIDLIIQQNSQSVIDTSICGTYVSPSGKFMTNTAATFTDTIPNAAGCDSVIDIRVNSWTPNTDFVLIDGKLVADPGYPEYQWIDCLDGEKDIPGATLNVYQPTKPGLYALRVNNGICAITTACYLIRESDLVFDANLAFQIYPNPSPDKVSISFAEYRRDISFSLYTTDGRLIESRSLENQASIEIQLPISSGAYILLVSVDGGRPLFYRIIKI